MFELSGIAVDLNQVNELFDQCETHLNTLRNDQLDFPQVERAIEAMESALNRLDHFIHVLEYKDNNQQVVLCRDRYLQIVDSYHALLDTSGIPLDLIEIDDSKPAHVKVSIREELLGDRKRDEDQSLLSSKNALDDAEGAATLTLQHMKVQSDHLRMAHSKAKQAESVLGNSGRQLRSILSSGDNMKCCCIALLAIAVLIIVIVIKFR